MQSYEKMFIGIDISKKTFDAVAIKAEGLEELMGRRIKSRRYLREEIIIPAIE